MNFVAVCLGIVITFAGQGLINRHAERNEVKSSLMLVKNELQDNLSYIELADSMLTRYSAAAEFLIRYEGHYSDAPSPATARLTRRLKPMLSSCWMIEYERPEDCRVECAYSGG